MFFFYRVAHCVPSELVELGTGAKFAKKRFAVRNFISFAELRIDIVDILQIIALFSVNTPVIEIFENMKHSKTAVTQVLTLVRRSITAYMDSTSPILGD